MKKVLSILMVAFAMTAIAACGDENNGGTNNGGGNNNGGNNGGDTPSHLSGLKYHILKNNGDGMTEHTITFGNGYEAEYHVVWNWPGANEDGSDWVGDETYRGTFVCDEQVENNAWMADGTFDLAKVGDSYTHYHSTFNADAGRLRLEHALPNNDVVNLDRDYSN